MEALKLSVEQFEDLFPEWNIYELNISKSNPNSLDMTNIPKDIRKELLNDFASVYKKNELYIAEESDDIIRFDIGLDILYDDGLEDLALEIEDRLSNKIYNIVITKEDSIVINYSYIGNITTGEKESIDRQVNDIIERFEDTNIVTDDDRITDSKPRKMKVSEFITSGITADVYDNYNNSLAVEYYNPSKNDILTKEGKSYFADILHLDIYIYDGHYSVEAVIDVLDDKRLLARTKELFLGYAGYINESDYNKWFRI